MQRDRLPTKVCATCGRPFAWRRRWRDDWDVVRYCSRRCRAERPGDVDRRLEEAIADLLAERPAGATICPSEAARRVSPDGWRPLMERTRRAARRLAAADEIVFLQKGKTIDPGEARGPIRLGKPR